MCQALPQMGHTCAALCCIMCRWLASCATPSQPGLQALGIKKVALLFLTTRRLAHERLWRLWLWDAAHVVPLQVLPALQVGSGAAVAGMAAAHAHAASCLLCCACGGGAVRDVAAACALALVLAAMPTGHLTAGLNCAGRPLQQWQQRRSSGRLLGPAAARVLAGATRRNAHRPASHGAAAAALVQRLCACAARLSGWVECPRCCGAGMAAAVWAAGCALQPASEPAIMRRSGREWHRRTCRSAARLSAEQRQGVPALQAWSINLCLWGAWFQTASRPGAAWLPSVHCTAWHAACCLPGLAAHRRGQAAAAGPGWRGRRTGQTSRALHALATEEPAALPHALLRRTSRVLRLRSSNKLSCCGSSSPQAVVSKSQTHASARPCRWGDISILDAEKALLREALRDPLNEK